MEVVLSVFRWIYNALKKSLSFIVTVPGIIASAVASVVSVIVSLFNGFSYWTDIVQWLNEATVHVSEFMGDSSALFQSMISFFALDRLIQISLVVLTSTFGVTVGIFVSMIVSVITLVPIVYGCKFTIKAISLATSAGR